MIVLAGDGDRAGIEGQRVQGGPDGALDRVLERDEPPLGLAALDGCDRLVHRRAGHGLDLGPVGGGEQRVMSVGPGGTEVGDSHGGATLAGRRCSYSKTTV